MEKSVFRIRDKITDSIIEEIVKEDQYLINDYLEKQSKVDPDDERFMNIQNITTMIKHFLYYFNNPQIYPVWTNSFIINHDDGSLTASGKIVVIETVSFLSEILEKVKWDSQNLSFLYTRC